MRSQGLAYLQVAVAAARAAPAFAQVTPGRAVEEVAVVVAAAVLFQDVPHLRLEERHVHVDRHHLQDTPEDTRPVWAHAAGLSTPYIFKGAKHDTQPGCAHAIPARYINKKTCPTWWAQICLKFCPRAQKPSGAAALWTRTLWAEHKHSEAWSSSDIWMCEL